MIESPPIRCILLILLSAASFLASGQERGSVEGIIVDGESGAPMEAVSIGVDHRSGTITGPSGEFELELDAGEHLLEFYYVGYEKEERRVQVEAGASLRLDLSMKVLHEFLDEVVVSAGKFEQKLSEVTVSMELIKPYQLSKQNITSLDEILEKTSGISILDGQPSIRGGSGFSYGVGSRVLMLVDDMPMISGDAGDIKWSYLPVENVNQVEIIKGASSVLYGSSALNGVINLRTRFPGNEPSTEATVFGGVYLAPRRKELIWKDRALYNGGASFTHMRKFGDLDFTLGGSAFKNEGYRELEYEQRIRGNLALRYRFKKVKGLSAGLSASGMYSDHADFILWQDADSGAYRQNPDTYAPLGGHRYNIDPYVEYYNDKGDKHSLRGRLYSVGNNTVDEDYSAFSKVWYAEYRYQKVFRDKIHWTNGVSFMRNTVDAGLFDEHAGSNTALYSQLDATIFDALTFSTGIRWELNSLDDEYFLATPVFRAGLNYQAGRATFLRASFGQGYRFPSIAEKYVDAHTTGLKIFPNPELEAEWGWNAEVGARQGFRLGTWTGFTDLAFFLTRYKNMIEYTFGVYPPEGQAPGFEDVGFKALNIENARILGAELSLSLQGRLGPVGVSAGAGYTFMDPVDPVMLDSTGRTEDEPYILKYRRKHLFKSDLEISIRKWYAGINFQYNSMMINVDEAFIHDFFGNVILPGFPDYWREHREGYFLADLRLGWNLNAHYRISLQMKNLFNVEYVGRPGDLGAPRQIILQMKFTF